MSSRCQVLGSTKGTHPPQSPRSNRRQLTTFRRSHNTTMHTNLVITRSRRWVEMQGERITWAVFIIMTQLWTLQLPCLWWQVEWIQLVWQQLGIAQDICPSLIWIRVRSTAIQTMVVEGSTSQPRSLEILNHRWWWFTNRFRDSSIAIMHNLSP